MRKIPLFINLKMTPRKENGGYPHIVLRGGVCMLMYSYEKGRDYKRYGPLGNISTGTKGVQSPLNSRR